MGRKANIAVVLLAWFALGTAVGLLAGLTEASAIVAVAVLPPLIVVGLGELRTFRIRTVRGGSTEESIVVPAGVGLLALGLIVGMLAGLAYNKDIHEGRDLEPRELAAPLAAPDDYRRYFLDECRIYVKKINAVRGGTRLAPETVCDPVLFALPPPPD